MHDVLLSAGYVLDKDFFYWHEPGGQHNEAAWAARAHRPLGVFAGL